MQHPPMCLNWDLMLTSKNSQKNKFKLPPKLPRMFIFADHTRAIILDKPIPYLPADPMQALFTMVI